MRQCPLPQARSLAQSLSSPGGHPAAHVVRVKEAVTIVGHAMDTTVIPLMQQSPPESLQSLLSKHSNCAGSTHVQVSAPASRSEQQPLGHAAGHFGEGGTAVMKRLHQRRRGTA